MIDDTIFEELDYDPGLLNNYGGGDVSWWMDYIRIEIDACNAYWRDLLQSHTIIDDDDDVAKFLKLTPVERKKALLLINDLKSQRRLGG